MRDDLQYDLCEGCGERSPKGQGLIPMVTHACPLNTVTYRAGKFSMRHLRQLFGGRDPMASFKELLDFPHFKKMEVDENTTWYDMNAYGHARDLEIKWMKRLRAYIDLEEAFDAKY